MKIWVMLIAGVLTLSACDGVKQTYTYDEVITAVIREQDRWLWKIQMAQETIDVLNEQLRECGCATTPNFPPVPPSRPTYIDTTDFDEDTTDER